MINKTIFFFLFFICSTELLCAQELIVVIVNKEKCVLSREVEQYFEDPSVIQRTKDNGQTIKMVYGSDYPKYLNQYSIRWYPTILKFERVGDRWFEKERIVGSRKIGFLLDFLGKRMVRPRWKNQTPVPS
jgi:hypothetical protein